MGVGAILVAASVEDLGDGGCRLDDDNLDGATRAVTVFAHELRFFALMLDRPDLAAIADDAVGRHDAIAELVVSCLLSCEDAGDSAKALREGEFSTHSVLPRKVIGD